MYNTYRFRSLRSLREALRAFKALEASVGDDSVSATIYLDLKRALGDDPCFPVTILSKQQRRLVQDYLIDGLPISEVAKKNNRSPRAILHAMRKSLIKLLSFLETQTEPDTNGWKKWMIDLLHDPYLSIDDLVQRTGKTKHAVSCAMSRYRDSENIPFRAVRKQATSREPE